MVSDVLMIAPEDWALTTEDCRLYAYSLVSPACERNGVTSLDLCAKAWCHSHVNGWIAEMWILESYSDLSEATASKVTLEMTFLA